MSRNFGLRSRDMTRAGLNALADQRKFGVMGDRTVTAYSSKWQDFSNFCRHELDIKKMEDISTDSVLRFVEHLQDKNLTVGTVKNYLAAINNVLRFATKDQWKSVEGKRDCSLASRTQVRTEATPERVRYEKALEALKENNPRAAAFLQLTREFGLRSNEAACLNAKTAIRQISCGFITIERGTKGGLKRIIPITNDRQILALKEAASLQGKFKSLIPHEQNYKQFQNSTVKVAREALREAGAGRIHDQRAAYASQRYFEKTGAVAPCDSDSRKREVARDLDHTARAEISEELGHHRIDVLRSYVGSSK